MINITLDLHGDLAHLAGNQTIPRRVRRLPEPAAVKDALEAVGIPHTEMDLILVAGKPVTFSYLVQDGDYIAAHPVPAADSREKEDLTWSGERLQHRPLHHDRFVCDQHLGKLARLLRMLGFDTAYQRTWLAEDLVRAAETEKRAVLTCHRALLKRKCITVGRLLRSRQPDEQLVEVVRRFGLADGIRFFGRCTVCNGEVAPVSKETIHQRIPPRTRQWRDEYYLCGRCDQLYWEGTHVAAVRQRLSSVLANI